MKYKIQSKKYLLNRIGLFLITSFFILTPNSVLADKKNSAFYWSGSLAAVCNLNKSGKISDIDAKTYIRKVLSYVDKMPYEHKSIVFDWFNKLNNGTCRRHGL